MKFLSVLVTVALASVSMAQSCNNLFIKCTEVTCVNKCKYAAAMVVLRRRSFTVSTNEEGSV
ncbi:hypothetical protein HYALB_00010669 [Hymenoscyphus albidus]|uniref:Uncharacterized protein n=1 Tax=Hymenoscyphus albidus TaxID=595503 RepID=A0A9N9LED0_9HELO|nr:hypothetical protein HYALB_00010669 [Hymenoscyphus albidus]